MDDMPDADTADKLMKEITKDVENLLGKWLDDKA
jgi:hypothetical protein